MGPASKKWWASSAANGPGSDDIHGLQRPCDLGVVPAPLARRQLLVEGVSDERVCKSQPPRFAGYLLDEPCLDGVVQRVEQIDPGLPGGALQDVDSEVPARDSR